MNPPNEAYIVSSVVTDGKTGLDEGGGLQPRSSSSGCLSVKLPFSGHVMRSILPLPPWESTT